jgi:hypothetical protein
MPALVTFRDGTVSCRAKHKSGRGCVEPFGHGFSHVAADGFEWFSDEGVRMVRNIGERGWSL